MPGVSRKGSKGFKKARSSPLRPSEDMCLLCRMFIIACVCNTTPGDKRRRRSDLDTMTRGHWYSDRYLEETHTQYMLDEGNVVMTSGKITNRQKKAAEAAQTRWSNYVQDEEGTVFEDLGGGKLGPGMSAARRTTISFFYHHHFGSPPETEWDGRGGVLHQIMRRVGIPDGSRNETRKVMEEVAECQANGEEYDGSGKYKGRNFKINRDLPEAKVIYVAMQAGVGITETTVMVNQFREEKSEDNEPISWTAVKNFIHSCKCMKLGKRRTKKSGKEDDATPWALARLAQAQQLKTQLEIGNQHTAVRVEVDEQLGIGITHSTLVVRVVPPMVPPPPAESAGGDDAASSNLVALSNAGVAVGSQVVALNARRVGNITEFKAVLDELKQSGESTCVVTLRNPPSAGTAAAAAATPAPAAADVPPPP